MVRKTIRRRQAAAAQGGLRPRMSKLPSQALTTNLSSTNRQRCNELRTRNGGGRRLVEGKHILHGDNRIAFQFWDYDRRRPRH